jgi:hypothetical protein
MTCGVIWFPFDGQMSEAGLRGEVGMASMVASRVNRSLVEYRHFEPSEHVDLIRFFREAGFPIAILPKDKGWGAWAGDRLVGCIALCHEA